MYKRVLISVGTVVVLVLVAACGFMLGNRVKGQTQDTENGQSAYMSSQQEESEAEASENGEDTAQTAADGDIAQTAADGDTAQANSDDSTNANGSVNVNGSVNTDDASTVNEYQAASGEYEYIIYAEDGTLVVYYSDAATVYFDSGIEVQHLPEETRNQVEQGITFQSEEELFGFLESYSS